MIPIVLLFGNGQFSAFIEFLDGWGIDTRRIAQVSHGIGGDFQCGPAFGLRQIGLGRLRQISCLTSELDTAASDPCRRIVIGNLGPIAFLIHNLDTITGIERS